MRRELSKKFYPKENRIIEAGINGTQLIIFSNDFLVYTNLKNSENIGLHKTILEIGKEFLNAELLSKFTDDCIYQKMELP